MTATGPEPDPPVWKIYDAIDRQNGKVRYEFILCLFNVFAQTVFVGNSTVRTTQRRRCNANTK